MYGNRRATLAQFPLPTEGGGNLKNIAVAGESAGGNLAMNIAISARDSGITQPKYILAIYQIADANTKLASKLENIPALPLSTSPLAWFGLSALRGPTDQQGSRFNLVVENLAGLPPVTIVNAQIDPLNCETSMAAMRAAGGTVDRRVYHGTVDEFFSMADVVRDASDAQ